MISLAPYPWFETDEQTDEQTDDRIMDEKLLSEHEEARWAELVRSLTSSDPSGP